MNIDRIGTKEFINTPPRDVKTTTSLVTNKYWVEQISNKFTTCNHCGADNLLWTKLAKNHKWVLIDSSSISRHTCDEYRKRFIRNPGLRKSKGSVVFHDTTGKYCTVVCSDEEQLIIQARTDNGGTARITLHRDTLKQVVEALPDKWKKATMLSDADMKEILAEFEQSKSDTAKVIEHLGETNEDRVAKAREIAMDLLDKSPLVTAFEVKREFINRYGADAWVDHNGNSYWAGSIFRSPVFQKVGTLSSPDNHNRGGNSLWQRRGTEHGKNDCQRYVDLEVKCETHG